MPGGGQWAGFGLAVTHHHRNQQVGVVESRTEGMREAVAQLAALVNRSRSLRRAVAADAPGKGEIAEELQQASAVFCLVWVDFGIGALQVHGCQYARCAVAGPCQVNGVEVIFADKPVQVHVQETQTRAATPVAEQPLLDVLRPQWFPQ